jgi:hypothetical protein
MASLPLRLIPPTPHEIPDSFDRLLVSTYSCSVG